MLHTAIRDWLGSIAPDRATQVILDKGAVLATDVGIKRQENQDRVAAIRVLPAAPRVQPFFCFALSDGMGGMNNGGECATLTLSEFFVSLIQSKESDPVHRLLQATHRANDTVNKFANGKGGATLVAVLVERNGASYFVHVGDSRIYTTRQHEAFVTRVTVDDTLKEAFGGAGNELVQFIGIGKSILPKAERLTSDTDSVYLTSDGAHFIDPPVFEQIVRLAPDAVRAAERLVALSRWLGGPDNASVVSFQVRTVLERFEGYSRCPAIFWSGGRELEIIPMPNVPPPPPHSGSDEPVKNDSFQKPRKSGKRPAKRARKHEEPKQLEIKISADDDSDGTDSE